MTAPTDTADPRRRAAALFGALAGPLLVAGGLPWVAGGPLAVRLLALPLLAAGLLTGTAGLRAWLWLRRAAPGGPAGGARPGRSAGCACQAGPGGCCAGSG